MSKLERLWDILCAGLGGADIAYGILRPDWVTILLGSILLALVIVTSLVKGGLSK